MVKSSSKFIALVAALVAATLAPPAQASLTQPLDPLVPVEIKAPPGNKVFLVGHALGVQIYECASTPTGFDWRFVAPRATLFDNRGKPIIAHFGGPTWQARDGSRVIGRLERSVTVNRTAIPWLLLSAASTSAGPADGNELVDTTFIQRIRTQGGLAPPVAFCNKATLGDTFESPYTSDYVFFKAA